MRDNWLRLHTEFYRGYESTRFQQLAGRYDKDTAAFQQQYARQHLGEGRFCRAYRIPCRLTQLDRVLCIAHGLAPAAYQHSPLKSGWWLHMQQLKKLYQKQIPLIPPFELLAPGRSLAWVMPYGESPGITQGSLDPQLEKASAALHLALGQVGLVLSDSLQLRIWQGIAFVHDFSDLSTLANAHKLPRATLAEL